VERLPGEVVRNLRNCSSNSPTRTHASPPLSNIPQYDGAMGLVPFSASGKSFSIHEWRGSGPATLHVHHSDDEAWHVLEGELMFRLVDRTETAGPGTTVFVRAGVAHTFSAGAGTRYLIILTPRLSALISALQADRNPARQSEIYRQFDSELLE
jgi:mannose-6-phosphate isomerase-like protein (cupin superfamily)